MPSFSEHPWLSFSLGSLYEVGVRAASPHGHTLSGMPPGMQSYWHCPGSFRTRTQYIYRCRSHSRSGPSRHHRARHHEAGSTCYRWMERQGLVGVPQLPGTRDTQLFQILELESPHPNNSHTSCERSQIGGSPDSWVRWWRCGHQDSSRKMTVHTVGRVQEGRQCLSVSQ